MTAHVHDSAHLVRVMDSTDRALEALESAVKIARARAQECRRRATEAPGEMVDVEDLAQGLLDAGAQVAAAYQEFLDSGRHGPPGPVRVAADGDRTVN